MNALGKFYKDQVTGQTGIATSRTEFLTGNVSCVCRQRPQRTARFPILSTSTFTSWSC